MMDATLITTDTADRRDLRPLRKPRGSSLQFHITIGGDRSTPVMIRVDAWCQRRAEQFALQWARTRWYRDQRALFVAKVELVD